MSSRRGFSTDPALAFTSPETVNELDKIKTEVDNTTNISTTSIVMRTNKTKCRGCRDGFRGIGET